MARNNIILNGPGDFIRGTISIEVSGSDDGGDPLLKAANDITLANFDIDANNEDGIGGSVYIYSNNFYMNNSTISLDIDGSGAGGALEIMAANEVIIREDSEISLTSDGAGGAGNIYTETGFLHLYDADIIIQAVSNTSALTTGPPSS